MNVANLLGQLTGLLTGTLGVPGTIVLVAVLVGGFAVWRSL